MFRLLSTPSIRRVGCCIAQVIVTNEGTGPFFLATIIFNVPITWHDDTLPKKENPRYVREE